MKQKQKRVWPVVLAAAIVTAAALTALFGQDVINRFRADSTQNELQELYKGGSLRDWLLPTACAEGLPEEKTVHEDFAELYAQNPHLVGWLSLGEDIDYPVVQHDNSYYLEHNFFGNSDANGTIFVNAANELEPRDSVLLIHGHNMKSGAMFGDLDLYRGTAYLKQYPIVSLRMLDAAEADLYVPIAAFDASMNPEANGYFDLTRIRFDYDQPTDDPEVWRSSELEAYIREVRELSMWDSPVEADSTDRFIVLVTCSYSHDDGRMMLVCRQLRETETAESVAAMFE